MSARARAVALITEGACPELIDRWGPERLPHLHRLRALGASGPLRSDFVPYEAPGLFSAFTGFAPDEHGCFSYWDVHAPDYRPVVLDGSAARRPFLWRRPELTGRRVALVNVFGTHPVEPVDGYCLSYPMRATVRACHPRNLPVLLAREGVRPVHDVTVWFTGGPKDPFVAGVLNADRQRADAALAMLDGRVGDRPDLTVLNLTAIDRLSHVYWQETEPGSPVPEADQAVLRAYQLADRVLGELLERLDDHTSLLAFSEIGFGPLRSYRSVNDVLAAAGLLTLGPDGTPDWSRTTAFEAVQGAQGVNLNLAGRYRDGAVRPADRARVLADVAAVLEEHINPATGTRFLTRAIPREELHAGPAADAAPDLVLDPADWRYLPLGDPFWSGRTNRMLQSGWHRRDSYWAGAGAAFTAGRGGPARPLDVAPTLLTMLGLDPAPDLPGTALTAPALRPAPAGAS
ncbi:alkaline phosphatase family protein [Streptomyces violaceusniger]|uniref:alkaline phosphatase family protein n=1 Tax=Streptomyces violaceusniger TaxID=68280 RepID=UPI0036A38C83